MKTTRFYLSLFFLFFLLHAYVYSQTVSVSVSDSDYPFTYKDENTGKAAGVFTDLVENLFREMGVSAEIIPLPWNRVLYYGLRGKTGIIGLYKTKALEEIYDFSDPIYIEKIHLYFLSDEISPPASFEDLKDKTIGILAGWKYGDLFESEKNSGLFSTMEKQEDRDNFNLLEHRRIDYVLDTELGGIFCLCADENFRNIRMSSLPLIEEPVYLVFNKNTNRKELLKKFNRFLSRKKEDGSYNLLIENTIQTETSRIKRSHGSFNSRRESLGKKPSSL